MTMQVAQTILDQLGGNRFRAMTGAKDFVGSANSLMFRLPRAGKNGINKVRITLTPNDTYKVEFMKLRKLEVKTVSTHEEIYCDMLTELFEDHTGLYTSL